MYSKLYRRNPFYEYFVTIPTPPVKLVRLVLRTVVLTFFGVSVGLYSEQWSRFKVNRLTSVITPVVS